MIHTFADGRYCMPFQLHLSLTSEMFVSFSNFLMAFTPFFLILRLNKD